MTTRIDRFWAKVDRRSPDECWEWTGSRHRKGYGQFSPDRAHRFSYALHHGPIPGGMFVCHSCDNPPCVNPAHLWLGSASDNERDAYAKGRKVSPSTLGPSGEASRGARLTNAQASSIRARHAAGERQVDLAAEFGVSQAAISDITRRLSYRDAA